jgi:heme oxygenase (biliverdin-IX-beta and delta-forming)
MADFVALEAVNQDTASCIAHTSSPSTILKRLRLETQDEHHAVERVLGVMDATFTREAYRLRLEQFYGFYSPLEAALQTRCNLPHACGEGANLHLAMLLPRLNKTSLLRQDLSKLGVTTEDLPHCTEFPPIRTHAEVLGCLYVLEGATLGGQMITRHIQATLGIMPTTGGRFFEGYAQDTAKMWQTMRQLLVSCALDAQTENKIVASAKATFSALYHWCDPRTQATRTH